MQDDLHVYEAADSDDVSGNPSGNKTFHEIVEARLSRRKVLRGLGTGAAVAVAGPALGLLGGTAAEAAGKGLTFAEIKHGLDGTHHVAPGYSVQVVVRWGDPIVKGAPAFDPKKVTADSQSKQFGYNNDFQAFMPLPRGSNNSAHGLLFSNHEYANAELIWPGLTDYNTKHEKMTREQALAEMQAHGLSVTEIKKEGREWKVVQDGRYNRRITATTPFRIAGPAAGHARMKTKADPAGTTVLGTLNNCAGGVTPWGTCLSGEENVNGYFGGDPKKSPEARNLARMTFSAKPRQPWYKFEDRFNVEKEPNEPNRFGWVVEADPYDPSSTPVKRTALGRMKHEGATCAVDKSGRVAVYTGDDQVYEYVYKFVTAGKFDPKNRAANMNLLDDGTLYVAKFNADGTMNWLPLVFGQGPLTAANGFNSQADVLIETRRAADLLGATKMDRPEDIEPDPLTGRVYIVLTKNAGRKAQETEPANPRSENKFGHIIELIPPGSEGAKGRMANSDHAATAFRWEMFLMGGDPADPRHGAKYGPGVSADGWIGTPDNIAFDRRGHLWIVTDGQDDALKAADSVYACDLYGPRRAATKLFFNAPRGAEVCGPCFTPDAKTLFVAIQHPSEEKGSTVDNPSTRWPDFKADLPPRPAVLAITKDDGGEIGG